MSPSGTWVGTAEASPRRKARLAAAVWVLYVAMSGLAGFARRGLIVSGGAAATATNILAHETAFRLAFAADLLTIACYVAMTIVLYVALKPVNLTVTLL